MANITWEESKKVLETFNHEQNFIYVDLVSRYVNSGCDGHDAHISAVETMITHGELIWDGDTPIFELKKKEKKC
jgi:hypothetical protein